MSAVNQSTLKAEELQERRVMLAVRCLRLGDAVPTTPAGRYMSLQIIRSGTSPAPDYPETHAAQSILDFVHKLTIVEKALNETSIGLDILAKLKMLSERLVNGLRDETHQPSRIIHRSFVAAKRRSVRLSKMTTDQ